MAREKGKAKGRGKGGRSRRSSEATPRTFTGKSATAGAEGSRRQPGGFRVPSILMVPVGAAVGWFVASWMGAIFGGVIGIFLWRSRA